MNLWGVAVLPVPRRSGRRQSLDIQPSSRSTASGLNHFTALRAPYPQDVSVSACSTTDLRECPTLTGDDLRRQPVVAAQSPSMDSARGSRIGCGTPCPSDGDGTIGTGVQVEPADGSAGWAHGFRRRPLEPLGSSRDHDSAAAIVASPDPGGSPRTVRIDGQSLGLKLGAWRAELHRRLEHPIGPRTGEPQLGEAGDDKGILRTDPARGIGPEKHVTAANRIDELRLGPRPVAQPAPDPDARIRTARHDPSSDHLTRGLNRQRRVSQAEARARQRDWSGPFRRSRTLIGAQVGLGLTRTDAGDTQARREKRDRQAAEPMHGTSGDSARPSAVERTRVRPTADRWPQSKPHPPPSATGNIGGGLTHSMLMSGHPCRTNGRRGMPGTSAGAWPAAEPRSGGASEPDTLRASKAGNACSEPWA